MELKKLSLDAAVDLRERLDREIHENYQTLVSQNSTEKGKAKADLKELLTINDSMETQVIRLKEGIQAANLKRHPRDRNSNSYYIYRLSQLKIRRDNLQKMSTKVGKFGKKIFEIVFSSKDVNKMITEINDNIDKISQKLSKFNTLRKNQIKVQWEPNLLYLFN